VVRCSSTQCHSAPYVLHSRSNRYVISLPSGLSLKEACLCSVLYFSALLIINVPSFKMLAPPSQSGRGFGKPRDSSPRQDLVSRFLQSLPATLRSSGKLEMMFLRGRANNLNDTALRRTPFHAHQRNNIFNSIQLDFCVSDTLHCTVHNYIFPMYVLRSPDLV